MKQCNSFILNRANDSSFSLIGFGSLLKIQKYFGIERHFLLKWYLFVEHVIIVPMPCFDVVNVLILMKHFGAFLKVIARCF